MYYKHITIRIIKMKCVILKFYKNKLIFEEFLSDHMRSPAIIYQLLQFEFTSMCHIYGKLFSSSHYTKNDISN